MRIFLRRDDAVRDEIIQDVRKRTPCLAPAETAVHVHAGKVTLEGTVEGNVLVPVIERLCRSVDGVVSVRAHIGYRFDASRTAPAGK